MPDYRISNKRLASSPAKVTARKQEMVDLLIKGITVEAALTTIGVSKSWYNKHKKADPAFRDQCAEARTIAKSKKKTRGERLELAEDFASFRDKYLGVKTWPHQQCWIDLLEGEEPSWMHESFQYEKGRRQRLLINTPPNHSKTTTITIDYAVYRICQNPNVRIMVVSKTQQMAKKFLHGIKQRLTHPRYGLLQATFAPEGGFKGNADKWTESQIYLGGSERDSGEPHPTVEAIGIGGQIYGARADLIICDDCVTLGNAGEWEKQMTWLRQEAGTRLGPTGVLLVVGTRVAPQDLYRELRNPDHYTDNRSPWTYFAQPAILNGRSDDPTEWEVLWPVAEAPFEGAEDIDEPDEQGNYPRWTGPRLKEIRNDLGATRWAMVYQQSDVAADPIFDPICVRGSINAMRKHGPLMGHAAGHPNNPEGFYIICSMDPAVAGDTAAVAMAVDRETHRRYVMDVCVMTAPTPLKIRELIKNWTELYRPNEWVIENNAFQGFLTNDEGIREFLATRGIPLKPHHTGQNKQDPLFGVASMQPLFGTKVPRDGVAGAGFKPGGDHLIELPDLYGQEGIKMLVDQLILWDPNVKTKHLKQDTVMALWFAELRAREILSTASRGEQWFAANPFTSRRDSEKRFVIPLDEMTQMGREFAYL